MSYTFGGVTEGGFGGYTLTDQMLYNIKWFLEWGLLHGGAYTIVSRGDEQATLEGVTDERFNAGQIWNGAGSSWVWESGVVVPTGYTEPFRVAGVYVNNTFLPVGQEGLNSYHVDYQNGRIIFDNGVNPTSVVEVEYCWRNTHVDFADCEDFRKLMQDALDSFVGRDAPSTDPPKEHQVWLPGIFLHDRSGTSRGLQLGGGQIKTRIVNAHIFSEFPWQRNLIADWFDNQNRKVLTMADLNQITFPFDQYGDIVDSATNWPTMVEAYPWNKMRFTSGNVRRLDSLNPNLFRAQAEWEIEIDIGGV